jgi:hypothetical protein
MLCEDAQQLAGAPHSRGGGRVGHRWGRTKGKIGFHGGKVAVHRPRVRGLDYRHDPFAAAAMRPVAPLGVECNKAASESHAHPIRTPLNSSWSKD